MDAGRRFKNAKALDLRQAAHGVVPRFGATHPGRRRGGRVSPDAPADPRGGRRDKARGRDQAVPNPRPPLEGVLPAQKRGIRPLPCVKTSGRYLTPCLMPNASTTVPHERVDDRRHRADLLPKRQPGRQSGAASSSTRRRSRSSAPDPANQVYNGFRRRLARLVLHPRTSRTAQGRFRRGGEVDHRLPQVRRICRSTSAPRTRRARRSVSQRARRPGRRG